MISKDEKQRLRGIISETITLLCKSRLFEKFKEEFYIEGLIGITLDQQELMMVSIHEKIRNDMTEDPVSPTKKDNPGVGETGSAKKRKTPQENGPKEKNPKVEKERKSPPQAHQALPAPVPNFNFDSFNSHKMLPSATPELHNHFMPTTNSQNHLERLKNFYMMNAGYSNVFNLNASQAISSLNSSESAVPGGVLNLAMEQNTPSQFSKSSSRKKPKPGNSQDMNKQVIKIKEEEKIEVKTEESSQSPGLIVPPLPVAAFPMYKHPPPRKHPQPVFNEPLLVPQVKSPTVSHPATHSPQRDAKLADIFDKIRNNIDSREDGSPKRSVFDHIAQTIVHTEGNFITSRMIGRKTGRKAVAIREVFLKLTTPVNNANHIGQAKEISRGTLVYYKCPPPMIKEEALTRYGLDMEMYKVLYYSEMKTPPSQHMLAVVEGHSPYVTGSTADDVFQAPPELIGAKITSHSSRRQELQFSSFENGSDDAEEISGLNSDVFLSHKQYDRGTADQDNDESGVKGIDPCQIGKDVDLRDSYRETNGLGEDEGLGQAGYEDHLDSSGSDRLLMDVGLPVAEDGSDREFDDLARPEDELIPEAEENGSSVAGNAEKWNGTTDTHHVQKGQFYERVDKTPLEDLEKLVSEQSAFR